MRGVWLSDLTWPEAQARFEAGAVVVIPVGAAAKEHGHHLPLGTDWILAKGITEGVMAELPIVAAPILGHGYYPAFRHYPGSQHLSPKTYARIIDEVLEGFADQGVRRMVILNTGISTEPVITVCLREFYERRRIRVLGANISRLGRESGVALEQKLGGHGDEHETSILLELAPEQVRMEKAQEDYGGALDLPESVFYVPTLFDGAGDAGIDRSDTGVRGDPTKATAEKGRALLDATVADVVSGIRAHFPEAV